MNFKNFGNDSSGNDFGGNNRPPANLPLARQPSIYSLTFDELQNTVGGIGKDFGSMNMDELLKNICSAEEIQTMASTSGAAGEGLQRQGSLTLPRTLSQKTVDEVWKNIWKEYGEKPSSNLPQRQQTLGEMTLEEFLVRAGVVREDNNIQLNGKPGNVPFFGDLSRLGNNNTGFGIGLHQMGRGAGLSTNQTNLQSNLPLNVNGVRSNQHQMAQVPQQQPPQIFPKQPTLGGYVGPLPLQGGAQLGSPGIRGGIAGVADQAMSSGLTQGAGLQGAGVAMVALGTGPVGVATGSPASQLSTNGIRKSNGDTSSVSPVPYVFNGGLRGRKCSGAVEKVVERRQRRMIKNRESAARSRARKQAYTMELEQEVAKLKEENQELQKKQAEIMEMQKNQALEMMNMQQGAKKRCLRRTQTGPW